LVIARALGGSTGTSPPTFVVGLGGDRMGDLGFGIWVEIEWGLWDLGGEKRPG